MKTKRKKNPTDSTYRNTRAANKRLAELEKTILAMGKLLKQHDTILSKMHSVIKLMVDRAVGISKCERSSRY